MKKGLLFLLILMGLMPSIANTGGYLGIVDRTITRDTLAIQFAFLDSLGGPIAGAAGDSILIMITSPAGTEVYRDSVVLAGVTALAWEDHSPVYVYAERVSVLDGSSTAVGVFSYSLMAIDVSLALRTYVSGTFQIINGSLEEQLDSAALGLQPTTAGRTLDIAATGEVSLNLGAVIGSLSDANIATIGVDVLSMAPDAIGDGDMASEVIAEIADAVWDEDTTGHKTAPQMGWAITQGGSATISDADFGIMADSVWLRDTTGVYQVGKLGFEATQRLVTTDNIGINWGDIDNKGTTVDLSATTIQIVDVATVTTTVTNEVTADMTKISGSALAADNLEEAFDDDATGPTMRLRGLVVVAAGTDSAAATFNGNGGAPGIDARGGATGNGVTFTGGATSGHGAVFIAIASGDGLKVEGGGTGNGLNARSGGGATGNAIQVTAVSTNGDAIGLTATGTGVDINAPDLVDLIWDEDSTGHYTSPQMAFVASQTAAGSGISDGDMIAIVDTLMGRNVPDDTTDGAGFDKNVADVLWRAGDTTNWASIADVTDTVNAMIDTLQNFPARVDLIWDEDSTGHYTSPQMAFVASQTSASSMTEISIVDTLMGRATADTTSGGAISKILKDANDALKPATIGRVLDVDVNNRAFVDVQAISQDAAAADTLEAWLDGYANSQLTNREHLFTNLDEVLSTRSKIGDTSLSADETLDSIKLFDTRFDSLLAALADNSIGEKVWEYDSANVSSAQAMGSILKDTSAYQGSGGGGGSDTTAILAMMDNNWTSASGGSGWAEMLNDTLTASHGSGAWTSSAGGSGSETVTVLAVDTVEGAGGTPLSVSDVKITVLNAASSQIGAQRTSGSGSTTWELDQEAHTLKGRLRGYLFGNSAITVTGAQTDTVFGYAVSLTDPGSADLSNVHGWLLDASDSAYINVRVMAFRIGSKPGNNAVDTVGVAAIIGQRPIINVTNSVGKFELFLRRSILYGDTTLYLIIGRDKNNNPIFDMNNVFVPATGNLNLGDTLAVRTQQ